jgi:hypothetical protein
VKAKMKIVCEVCGKEGYLQHIGKSYYRIRHYIGLDSATKKPKFEYHKQDIQYINKLLEQQKTNNNIDLTDQTNIDPNLLNLGSFNENHCRGSLAWFGRQTHNLENKKGANAQLSRGRGLESRPRHHFTSLDSLLGYFGQRTLICTREDIVVSSVARDRFKLSVQTFPAYYQFASEN